MNKWHKYAIEISWYNRDSNYGYISLLNAESILDRMTWEGCNLVEFSRFMNIKGINVHPNLKSLINIA